MTAGKLLAAIRESLDAALIQLNCPINMLAAARRLNGESRAAAARRRGFRVPATGDSAGAGPSPLPLLARRPRADPAELPD
jgi:hypothetical protein